MQRFSVATSKGFIYTSDFRSAMKVLQMEMERKREEIKKETQPADWDKEFETLLKDYMPKDCKEAIQKKYEGGEW
ncbi:hypothetical protein [Persephonella sp.]